MLTLVAVAMMGMQWPEREWAFKPVEAGGTSPIREERIFVLRNQAQLDKYMIERGSPRRPFPKIDWKTNQVVAVHIGSRPTASYSVDVRHFWKAGQGAELEINVTPPDPEMMVAQVITYPFAVVRTERFPGKVTLKSGD